MSDVATGLLDRAMYSTWTSIGWSACTRAALRRRWTRGCVSTTCAGARLGLAEARAHRRFEERGSRGARLPSLKRSESREAFSTNLRMLTDRGPLTCANAAGGYLTCGFSVGCVGPR